jgi:hypothetical protein
MRRKIAEMVVKKVWSYSINKVYYWREVKDAMTSSGQTEYK